MSCFFVQSTVHGLTVHGLVDYNAPVRCIRSKTRISYHQWKNDESGLTRLEMVKNRQTGAITGSKVVRSQHNAITWNHLPADLFDMLEELYKKQQEGE
jgi:hypothetical protein